MLKIVNRLFDKKRKTQPNVIGLFYGRGEDTIWGGITYTASPTKPAQSALSAYPAKPKTVNVVWADK